MRKPVKVGLSAAVVVAAGAVWSVGDGGRVAAPVSGNSGAMVVHVSPGGTVSSIAEAQNVLKEKGAVKGTVLVKGGVYRDEAFEWTYAPGGGEFTVRPEGNEKVVFDGGGREDYWGVVRGGVRFNVRGMTVRNYAFGGIKFRGDKGSGERATGSVRDMAFRDLGTKKNSGTRGYAGVHLYYSFGMDVRGNDFRYLENDNDPGQIHGVYFSDGGGRGSVVADNTFYKITGDAVRASDGAGGIRVTGNTFKTTGWYAPFSSWRFPRDHTCGADMTFSGNVYGKGYPRRTKTGQIKTPDFRGKPVRWDEEKPVCKPAPIRAGRNTYDPGVALRNP